MNNGFFVRFLEGGRIVYTYYSQEQTPASALIDCLQKVGDLNWLPGPRRPLRQALIEAMGACVDDYEATAGTGAC